VPGNDIRVALISTKNMYKMRNGRSKAPKMSIPELGVLSFLRMTIVSK
jgi:hypothetical protein